MGLLDLPAPLFDAVDHTLLAPLPPVLRLLLWAIAGAIVSLALYRLLSPQQRIAEAKKAALAARRQLNAHEGDFESALPLMRRSMAMSLRHVGLVLPAAVAASLPVLALLVWLDATYGYQLPNAQQTPAVTVEPAGYSGQWQRSGAGGQIELRARDGAQVARLTLAQPVTRIEKRHWWNVILGNPAGYLPDESPIDSVAIALPERQYLSVGPEWARSWFVLAFATLLVTSILIMRIARIA